MTKTLNVLKSKEQNLKGREAIEDFLESVNASTQEFKEEDPRRKLAEAATKRIGGNTITLNKETLTHDMNEVIHNTPEAEQPALHRYAKQIKNMFDTAREVVAQR